VQAQNLIVNGVQQGNVVDLPSTTGLWRNYSVIWSAGAPGTALLEIRMLTTESYGNDFVLEDLSSEEEVMRRSGVWRVQTS